MSIKTSQEGQIQTITIARPEKRNALTLEMYQALTEALRSAQEERSVRAVILTGEGGCFSAGNDIVDFVAAASRQDPAALAAPTQFLQTISTFTKPLVAAVEGDAIGIGTSMLLHCDLVYAAADAKLQLPFARLGLVPEGGTSLLLPQQLGHRLAFELLVKGDAVSGERAAQLGLINAASNSPMADAQAAAQSLVALAPAAVRQSKAMLREHQGNLLQKVLLAEIEQFAARLSSAEAQEAFSAFMEKRAPVFSDI